MTVLIGSTFINNPYQLFMRSFLLTIVICFFQATTSNAMQSGGLRGEFLDIMGRKIITTHGYSTKKAIWLDIIRRDQISTLIRDVAQELEIFDIREYFTSYEQGVTLKNITKLCHELEVFLQQIIHGLHAPMYAYPLHAQLVYTMEKQLSEFCAKIGYCPIGEKQAAA